MAYGTGCDRGKYCWHCMAILPTMRRYNVVGAFGGDVYTVETEVCTKCSNENKPLEDFYSIMQAIDEVLKDETNA